MTDFQERLDELSKKVDELKEKAKHATGDAGKIYRSAISDLESKRDVAQKKLKELGSASSGAWQEIKVGVDKAYDELQKAYKEAVAKFR